MASGQYKVSKTGIKSAKSLGGSVILTLLGVVVAAVAGLFQTGQLSLEMVLNREHWPYVLGVIVGAGGTAVADWLKHGGLSALRGNGARLLLVLLLPSVLLSGCVAPAMAGRHSGVEFRFAEVTPDGGSLDIEWEPHGEAESQGSVRYTGAAVEGETPWALEINGSGTVTSPQSLAIAEGAADAYREAAAAATAAVGQIDALLSLVGVDDGDGGGGAGNVRGAILQIILDQILARFGP